MKSVRNSMTLLALGLGIFAVGFWGAYREAPFAGNAAALVQRASDGRYVPLGRTREGAELALIYIGSSGCVPSNQKGLSDAVEELKLAVRETSARNGRSFTAVGIARDWDAEAGLDHLRKFGRFDELLAGRNWLNMGVRRYVWEELPGEAATPQILIVERFVGNPAPTARGIQYVIRDERLVTRKVGAEEILRWARQGAPLPDLAPL